MGPLDTVAHFSLHILPKFYICAHNKLLSAINCVTPILRVRKLRHTELSANMTEIYINNVVFSSSYFKIQTSSSLSLTMHVFIQYSISSLITLLHTTHSAIKEQSHVYDTLRSRDESYEIPMKIRIMTHFCLG